MARPLGLGVLAVLLFSVTFTRTSCNSDGMHCERIINTWASSSAESEEGDDKLNLKDLLFFLHIPRTGGRTYFHCFLKKLYTNAQECPRSYDKLRFDPSHPNCKLVVSHDDYSLISKLPKDRTSLVTILRNPVDRVFSTYEFSVEVAARFLVHPNLTSAKLMTNRMMPKSRAISTLDIWPWKYLVPWMREDLFARRDARGMGQLKSKHVGAYDVEDMVLPLQKYINHPVAHDIIHNGATFQVAGLTNNSHFDRAHEIRHCVRRYPKLGRLVLEVAKSRLDRMLYVGITEDHEESARLFAHMVGAQVLSQSGTLNLDVEAELSSRNDSQLSMVDPEDEEPNQLQNSTNSRQNVGAPNATTEVHGKGNMTVGKLMEAYETCVMKLRKSQSIRRKMSLERIEGANFSKEARHLVPEAVLKQIISLNSLDMELYEHAQDIFRQQHQKQKIQSSLMSQPGQLTAQKDRMNTWFNTQVATPWKVIVCGVGIALIIILTSFAVTTRRRTSKLKV